MIPDASHPTVPSKGDTSVGSAPSALAIRWVFPDPHGRLSRLYSDRVVLGRGEGCDIDLPGEEVSRWHAEICREGSAYVLKDTGSRNGIFLNGAQATKAILVRGQVVRIGEWIGVVVAVDAALDEQTPVFELFAPKLAGGPVLRPLVERLQRAAPSDLPVVLAGETGSGKEGLARAIHAWSGRTGPFLAINCATLTPPLADAELFGHRRGSFTGADRSSPGLFRSADRGTLFLDELTDLPEATQPKLLRVLQESEVVPLGESRPVSVNVRVLVATQVPLDRAVAERGFRADLCARLDAMSIRVPPLRERKEEVPYLFRHLLGVHSGGRIPALEPRLIEQLCLHDWPFNVRELELLARSLLVFHGHETILRRSFLPERMLLGIRTSTSRPAPSAGVRDDSAPSTPAENTPEFHRERRERELAALLEALRTHDGILARAAAACGISRQRAYRLLESTGGVGANTFHSDRCGDESGEGS